MEEDRAANQRSAFSLALYISNRFVLRLPRTVKRMKTQFKWLISRVVIWIIRFLHMNQIVWGSQAWVWILYDVDDTIGWWHQHRCTEAGALFLPGKEGRSEYWKAIIKDLLISLENHQNPTENLFEEFLSIIQNISSPSLLGHVNLIYGSVIGMSLENLTEFSKFFNYWFLDQCHQTCYHMLDQMQK